MSIREHPKYMMVQGFDICRKNLLEAGDILLAEGRVQDRADIYWLSIKEAVRAFQEPDWDIISVIKARQETWQHYHHLKPPRVITSGISSGWKRKRKSQRSRTSRGFSPC